MKSLIKLLAMLSTTLLNATIAGMLALLLVCFYFIPQLPNTEQIRAVQLQTPLRIYTHEGSLIAEYGAYRRSPVTFEQTPDLLIKAILAAEDDRFFSHPGVDYQGLARAAVEMAKSGKMTQGGSTITMQVARNFFLSSDKNFSRKIREILLAFKMERELSKQEIFTLYLNKIFLGHRAYGVAAAAQIYYGMPLEQLSLAQLAMIAGLPKAPSAYNPIVNPKRALERRHYILNRMLKLRYITPEQHAQADTETDTAQVHNQDIVIDAPYAAEMVRAYMVEKYGEEMAYNSGYRVYTTLQEHLQQAANRALYNTLLDYDQRHGYRGAEHPAALTPATDKRQILDNYRTVAELEPGLVTAVKATQVQVYLRNETTITLNWDDLKWARPYLNENATGAQPDQAQKILKVGDLIRVRPLPSSNGTPRWQLAQIPAVEGAFIAISPKDGALLAVTGGFDFYQSKFNRATQAQRQPGSGFKPFIYSAALEKGFTAASVINDAPIIDLTDQDWRPANYDNKFRGPTRFREALVKSQNLVSIRILRKIGIPYAIDYAQRFGFTSSSLPPSLSLALGSGAASPLQMAEAYSTFANGGYKIKPYWIKYITNEAGTVVFQSKPATVCPDPCGTTASPPATNPETAPLAAATVIPLGNPPPENPAPRIITPQNHYIMNSIMQDVIKRGTARQALGLKRNDIAGKTGTTNDQRDAWFYGFTPDLVAISWIGFDNFQPLGKGETGGHAALPMWIEFMQQALPQYPENVIPQPPGIVSMRIDRSTGQRAAAGQENTLFEIFQVDANADPATAPTPETGWSDESVSRQPRDAATPATAAPAPEDIF